MKFHPRIETEHRADFLFGFGDVLFGNLEIFPEGNALFLLDPAALLGELGSLSNALKRLTEQTTRDPSGLLFGRTPVPTGPGEKEANP